MSDEPKRSKALFAIMGCIVLPIIVVGVMSPPSRSGGCYLFALVLMWLGPWLSHRRIFRALPERARRRTRVIGLALFAATVSVRMFAGSSEQASYEQVGEPSMLRAAFAHLANERDLSGGATTLLRAFSTLPPRGDTLGALFRDTYDRMDAADENPASPLLPTLLFGQSPESFDLLRYHVPHARGTLLFLHGYGGNVSAICWEVAQSAEAAGYETLCPSMRTRGDWGSPRGSEIVRLTLDEIDGPVVLAGLSNGANGAAILAPRFRRDIEGLVLIAGAAQQAGRAGVPTLVVYGRHDQMFRPRVMRSYAERTDARSVVLDAGHFIVLSERERVRAELTRFLAARLP